MKKFLTLSIFLVHLIHGSDVTVKASAPPPPPQLPPPNLSEMAPSSTLSKKTAQSSAGSTASGEVRKPLPEKSSDFCDEILKIQRRVMAGELKQEVQPAENPKSPEAPKNPLEYLMDNLTPDQPKEDSNKENHSHNSENDWLEDDYHEPEIVTNTEPKVNQNEKGPQTKTVFATPVKSGQNESAAKHPEPHAAEEKQEKQGENEEVIANDEAKEEAISNDEAKKEEIISNDEAFRSEVASPAPSNPIDIDSAKGETGDGNLAGKGQELANPSPISIQDFFHQNLLARRNSMQINESTDSDEDENWAEDLPAGSGKNNVNILVVDVTSTEEKEMSMNSSNSTINETRFAPKDQQDVPDHPGNNVGEPKVDLSSKTIADSTPVDNYGTKNSTDAESSNQKAKAGPRTSASTAAPGDRRKIRNKKPGKSGTRSDATILELQNLRSSQNVKNKRATIASKLKGLFAKPEEGAEIRSKPRPNFHKKTKNTAKPDEVTGKKNGENDFIDSSLSAGEEIDNENLHSKVGRADANTLKSKKNASTNLEVTDAVSDGANDNARVDEKKRKFLEMRKRLEETMKSGFKREDSARMTQKPDSKVKPAVADSKISVHTDSKTTSKKKPTPNPPKPETYSDSFSSSSSEDENEPVLPEISEEERNEWIKYLKNLFNVKEKPTNDEPPACKAEARVDSARITVEVSETDNTSKDSPNKVNAPNAGSLISWSLVPVLTSAFITISI